MITYSLQSGSNGNAIYVEAGDARLLFDASGRLVWSRPTQGPGAREFLLPRLSSGVYLLRLDGPDGATECKLVMQ